MRGGRGDGGRGVQAQAVVWGGLARMDGLLSEAGGTHWSVCGGGGGGSFSEGGLATSWTCITREGNEGCVQGSAWRGIGWTQAPV